MALIRKMLRNENCTRKTFILDYTYKGHLATVKQQITEMQQFSL
jgi:hypothetical protein